MTEETRNLLREINAGENNGFYGKNHSEKTKRKLSDMASKRTGDKNSFYGRTYSEETKEELSRTIANLYKRGWRHPQKGIPKTEEQKRNNMLSQPNRKSVMAEGV